MKKKNGFISISIIYSFFLVFMLLLVLIMASYVNNRTSLNIYKKDIKVRIAKNSSNLNLAYTYEKFDSKSKLAIVSMLYEGSNYELK